MSGFVLGHDLAGPVEAPPLVMVGSLGTTLAMWEPELPFLEAVLRLVRIDLRGHGVSPVPDGPYSIAELGEDVLATIDALGIERVCYCGVSIGGMIGMWLAANVPERIERLILICTSAHIPGSTYAERAVRVRRAGTVEVIADEVLDRWFTPSWVTAQPELAARYRAMLAAVPAMGYAGCCDALASLDLRHELARIAAPTLVVVGAEDSATPPEHGRAIADGIPRARYAVVEEAAHLANVEQPEAISEMIAEHLEILEER